MTDPFPGSSSGAHRSNLRESLLKARIAKLPHLPAIAPGRKVDEEEEEEEENDSLGSLSMAKPTSSTSKLRSVHSINQDEYSPISANDCFLEALEIDVGDESSPSTTDGEGDKDVRSIKLSGDKAVIKLHSERKKTTFRVYYTPPQKVRREKTKSTLNSIDRGLTEDPPAISLSDLHNDDEEGIEDDDDQDESSPTIFLLHHGAGYSALSFALVAKSITQQTNGNVGVLAYDCRGHGRTAHPNDSESNNLSLERLTKDGLAILKKLFPPTEKIQPNLILIGHSMGGAVVVSMAHALTDGIHTTEEVHQNRPRVAGVAVLDVVEGTAIAALPNMKTIVSNLPNGFNSIEDAIQWHVESGTIINPQSARRSVPSLLKKNESFSPQNNSSNDLDQEPIEEILGEPGTEKIEEKKDPSRFSFVWRHNLLATEPHWRGWFEGLSDSFLKVRCAKLLLLAGTDRLDKDLMIGQMQGKYQLVVFPDVGHSLQEDAPQRTAQTLVDFWRRNEMVDTKTIKSLRKVGQP